MATIVNLVRERVTLQVRSVDRLFLQGYVPKLMTQGQVIGFLLERGNPIPSPALLGKQGRAYREAIERFAAREGIRWCASRSASRRRSAPYLERAQREGRFGVVMIGVAQEKTLAWRGWRRGGSDSHPHFEFGRQSTFPNHYYFYLYDRDWGLAFVKCCSYAPFPVSVCLNGHEWAKRQAQRRVLRFEALDNGLGACTDPVALGGICDSLGAPDVERFFRRWQARLPVAVYGRRSPPRLPLRARLPPARAVRHQGVRPPPGGPGVVRAHHPRSAAARAPRPGGARVRPQGQSPQGASTRA